jgi:HEPN domain-containing protein
MTNEEKSLIRFHEWERYALEDEQTINSILRDGGVPNQICMHAQQMAEKYLKGFLAYHKNIPLKTHNLEQLIGECEHYDTSFPELKEYSILLNQFYIEARYPGDIIEFSIEQAKEGYESAKKIQAFVLEKVK